MSIQGNIKIKAQVEFDLKKILKTLLNNDWSYDDYGYINYCSEGNDFDWSSYPLTEIENITLKMLSDYEKGNIVGITLINTKVKSGGIFLFYPNQNKIEFSISIYRILIGTTNITDYSVYLEQLNNVFSVFECYWECSDY